MQSTESRVKRLGYARVSTTGQSLDRQLAALHDAECANIFTDTASGSRSDRPGLSSLKMQVRSGDTVVVVSLDRLGRSMSAILSLIHEFAANDITVETLDGLSTSPKLPGGKILLAVTAAMAEVEHDLIVERTQAGLKTARARGKVGGRKPRLSPAQERAIVAVAETGEHSLTSIAADFQISRSTLHRVLRRHKR